MQSGDSAEPHRSQPAERVPERTHSLFHHPLRGLAEPCFPRPSPGLHPGLHLFPGLHPGLHSAARSAGYQTCQNLFAHLRSGGTGQLDSTRSKPAATARGSSAAQIAWLTATRRAPAAAAAPIV